MHTHHDHLDHQPEPIGPSPTEDELSALISGIETQLKTLRSEHLADDPEIPGTPEPETAYEPEPSGATAILEIDPEHEDGLAEREARVVAESRSIARQRAQLDQMEASIEEQRRAIERDAEHYAKLQQEMAQLYERLTQAEVTAKAREKAEGDPEKEARWSRMESECVRLKRELSTARVQVQKAAETVAPAPTAALVPGNSPRDHAMLAAGLIVAAGVLALAIPSALLADLSGASMPLGPAFVATFLAAALVKRRLFHPMTPAIAISMGAGGIWLPAWIEACRETFGLWGFTDGVLPPLLEPLAPIALAIGSASLLSAWLLYLWTGSGSVLANMLTCSVLVAMLALVPTSSSVPLMIAAGVWHLTLAASLFRWVSRSGASLMTSLQWTGPAGIQRPSLG